MIFIIIVSVTISYLFATTGKHPGEVDITEYKKNNKQ